MKQKLVISLLIPGSILGMLFYTAFHVTISPSLEDQKIIFIETLKKKIQSGLSIEKENIAIHCSNWANWESMGHYVLNPSREFETEVFPDLIFHEDIMDFIMVIKISHQASEDAVLFYNSFKDEKFLIFDQLSINKGIQKIKANIKRKPGVVNTLLNSRVGPLIVVACPISISSKLKKASGVLILGRFLDEIMLEKISRYTLEKISSFSYDPKKVIDFYFKLMKENDVFYREDGDKLTIFYLLKDIHHQPALILYTQANNRLFQVVNQHFITFSVITVLSILFLGLLLYYSIQKYIIIRMLNISDSMGKIEKLSDLSKRIKKDNRNDEISQLIFSINIMLDKLEQEKINRENAERTIITQGKLVSIGRLASCIGHEINNPLLAIGNSIQVIKKISRSKSTLFKEALEICESEIERIRDLISNLLDFHRLEKNEYSHFNIKEIIQKSLDVLKWSQKLESIKIITNLENDCIVYGSSSKLKQVFINFILNAVEAMESEKHSGEIGYGTNEKNETLRIEAKYNKGENIIEVHFLDNGPGIPEEIKSHLFEPFVSTKGTKGVGLGLYISYKIIDNHKGEIIYNANSKQGTHFIIKLPAIKGFGND